MPVRTTRHKDVTLDLHADVASWNPNAAHTRTLAVGTYELDEATQVRHGKLYTYHVSGDVGDVGDVGDDLCLECKYAAVDLPGIFDLHCMESPTCPTTVALALADGSVRLIDVSTGMQAATTGPDEVRMWNTDTYEDCTVAHAAPTPLQAMALTVDTRSSSSPESPTSSTSIAASYSDGSVKLFDVAPGGALVPGRTWAAHTLEAWMATWSTAPSRAGNVVYTGGDDAVFQAWDVRERSDSGEPSRLFVDRKTHGAGVTSVGELGSDHAVMTGSYDNILRIWDWRNSTRPVVQASLDLGGGVWRLKPRPDDPNVLLAATMYDGFKVVRVDRDGGGVRVEQLAEFPAQKTDKTLAYGASWCREPGLEGLAATCSFYDNLLSLWSVEML